MHTPVEKEIINAIDKKNLLLLNVAFPLLTRITLFTTLFATIVSAINTCHDIWKWIH
jgi:hypothetical protein